MNALTFTPEHEWTAAGDAYEGGVEHSVPRPSAELRKLAACALAAGVLRACEGHDAKHVQSQEDGEAAYAEAQADGRWHEGAAVQAVLDEAAKAEFEEEAA